LIFRETKLLGGVASLATT